MTVMARGAGGKAVLLFFCAVTGLLLFGFYRFIAGFNPAMVFLPAVLVLFFVFLHLRFRYQIAILVAATYFPGHQILTFLPFILWLKDSFYQGKFNINGVEVAAGLILLISYTYNDGQPASLVFYLFSAWYWWFFFKWLRLHKIDDNLANTVVRMIFFFQTLQLLVFIPDFIRITAPWGAPIFIWPAKQFSASHYPCYTLEVPKNHFTWFFSALCLSHGY
jgi:hypothetical protein